MNHEKITEETLKSLKLVLKAATENKIAGQLADDTYWFMESNGICYNNYVAFCELNPEASIEQEEISEFVLFPLFLSWSKFSGSLEFPVPATLGLMTPGQQYISFYNVWTGEYGSLRFELLVHMINKLDEKIND